MRNFVFTIALSLVLFSCTKEELKFSCDPEIDAIVKSSVVEFSEVSLTEFLEYDIQLQKAIFRSFTYDKKKEFWLEKLDSVLVNYAVTSKEILHVEKLILHVTEDYSLYEELDSIELSQLINFENEWNDYAENILLWSDLKIHFIVNSLFISEEQFSQMIADMKGVTLKSTTGSCNCSTESNYCSYGYCTSGGCSVTSGCGWLWQYLCNGIC